MKMEMLEEFIDEEVVDYQGKPIGTLSCYWESAKGQLFLGVKPRGENLVHVVPGLAAVMDEPHSCVILRLDESEVKSAPILVCNQEILPSLAIESVFTE